MRTIGKLLCIASVSATLAATPIGFDPNSPLSVVKSSAFAKNGGGNGNGGGHGSGGNGQGKGGNASSDKSAKSDGKSSQAKGNSKQRTDPVSRAIGKLFDKQKTTSKPTTTKFVKKAPAPAKSQVVTSKPLRVTEKPTLAAKLAGLNSLNRNYHAYLNSRDPRMVAISAYVTAYAQYELENGTDTIPTDPELSDDALRSALLSAANKNHVEQYGDDSIDQEVMDWAKETLGVGPAVGKIDQVRDALATGAAPSEETEVSSAETE